MITLHHLDSGALRLAQAAVARHHYLRAPVDARCSPQAWTVMLGGIDRVGYLIVGRPEATRCFPWYGSLDDVAAGRAGQSYWTVLNLARVWLAPAVQPGGVWHRPDCLPGYTDRRGIWRSTLASHAIGLLAARVGAEYLIARPPVYPDEPYAIRDLLSYCDTARHRGTIYRAAGFALARTNRRGIQTWRLPLAPLTGEEDAAILRASRRSPRARRFRAARASVQLPLAGVAS